MSIYTQSPCIYKITNHVTNKSYIGSTVYIVRRHLSHINSLVKNKHVNQKLQRAWNKYGSKTFSFQIIEFVIESNMLLEREQYYVEQYNSIRKGYNCRYPELRTSTKSYNERKEKRKEWYDNNKDLLKEKHKTYYENNKEKILSYRKEYIKLNKDTVREKHKTYCETNKESISKKNKEYRELKKEQLKEKRELKKDQIKKTQEKYRKANDEKEKQRKKIWYEAHREEILQKLREKRQAQSTQ